MTALILLLALHAPLPFLKSPAGTHLLTWCGSEWLMTLRPDGGCDLWSPSGTRWAGVWRVEKGRLYVSESPAPTRLDEPWPPATWSCRWSVKLPSGPDGKVGDGEVEVINMRRLR